MRQITPYPFWVGHIGDAADLRKLLDAGVTALVDLALNEAPPHPPRDLIYCRFPLVDGSGNAPALLRLAVRTTAMLLHDRTPTLVFCGTGMSRSPAVAAAALATFGGRPPAACLEQVAEGRPHDVSPGLWQDILGACFADDTAR
jgi:protein-tyrosine phosphatase